MTDRPRNRRPGPALVAWSSIALFAAMFALLTYQLSSGEAADARRPVLIRQVVKRRVVTTILPTPGRPSVTTSGPASGGAVSTSGYPPVTTGAS